MAWLEVWARGKNVAEGRPLASTWLSNLRNESETECGWLLAILKPYVSGKYSKKRKKTTYWKPKEYFKTKYKLSAGPVFTFSEAFF